MWLSVNINVNFFHCGMPLLCPQNSGVQCKFGGTLKNFPALVCAPQLQNRVGTFAFIFCYAALLPRRGPHIASHSVSVCLSVRLSVCLSVRPSVCPSVPLPLPSVTSRHLANYNDTHVLFATRWGPHIVRPSRPHKLVITGDYSSSQKNQWVLLMQDVPKPGYRSCQAVTQPTSVKALNG